MKAVAVLALAGAVVASPHFQKRQSIDPLSASLAVYNALPSSLQAEALTNPAGLASDISSEFLTGTPAWFSSLPTDVQSYFISAGAAGNVVPTSAPSSNSTGIFSNSTASITSFSASASSTEESSASTTEEASSESAASTASSSSSSGLAALPTQIIAGGLAGVVGFMGVLAL